MTDRYIIIVEKGDFLLPIVSADDDGLMAVYSTREKAYHAAEKILIGRAYPYSIINFDEAAE